MADGTEPSWLGAPGGAPAPGDAADATAATATAPLKKRPRAPIAQGDEQRALYRMVVRQLYSDGYVDAARAVANSTRCAPQGVSEAAAGGGAGGGQRLAQLVRGGSAAEALQRQLDATVATGGAETALYAQSVYSAPQPTAAYAMTELYVSFPFERPLRCAAYNPTDGNLIALGGSNGVVRVFDASLMEERQRLRPGAKDRGGKTAPSRSALVRVLSSQHDSNTSVEWVGFHPFDPIVASGARDGTVTMTNIASPETTVVCELKGKGAQDTFPIRAAAFEPQQGHFLAYATDHNALRLFHVPTQRRLTPSDTPHTAAIADVAWSRDGRLLSTGSYDGSWKLLDARTGAACGMEVKQAHSNIAVTSVNFSRSAGLLLTSGADSRTKLWDLRKANAEVACLSDDARKASGKVRSAFNFNETAVVVEPAGRAATQLVDLYSGNVAATITHQHPQRAVAVCPTRQAIATAGDDMRLRVWWPAAAAAKLQQWPGKEHE